MVGATGSLFWFVTSKLRLLTARGAPLTAQLLLISSKEFGLFERFAKSRHVVRRCTERLRIAMLEPDLLNSAFSSMDADSNAADGERLKFLGVGHG